MTNTAHLEHPSRPSHPVARSAGLHDAKPDKIIAVGGDAATSTASAAKRNGNFESSPPLLHLHTTGYSSHLRSDSRISWDGKPPGTASRTPSPSPPSSPARLRNRPRQRPSSAVGVPGSHPVSRPTVLADRWSYDRERMPSSPPTGTLHGSRPGTPVSEHAFSRPASMLSESRPGSRPQSILLNASAELGCSHSPSTPTLMVVPPADSVPWVDSDREVPQLPPQHGRQSYHLLTSEEMEMLSHPLPAHLPATSASPSPSLSPPPSPSPRRLPGTSPPTLSGEAPVTGSPKREHPSHSHTSRTDDSDDDDEETPGCLGICEVATARRVGGTFGAWFMGTLIPITLGLVTSCVASAGCR